MVHLDLGGRYLYEIGSAFGTPNQRLPFLLFNVNHVVVLRR
jgi:hypothetical protein